MPPSPTFTERARRQQLIEVTIAQLAEHGLAGTSLGRIAAAAGISKAAVLYHFAGKDAVLAAAYDDVLSTLVATVGDAVGRAAVADRPAAYVRAVVGHLAARPQHAQVIIETLGQPNRTSGTAEVRTQPEQRWRPVAALLQESRSARGRAPLTDPRTAAIALGGAIDAVVAEGLHDRGYDTARAAEQLIGWLERLIDA